MGYCTGMNAEELKACHHILDGVSHEAHLIPSIHITSVEVVTLKQLPTPVLDIQYNRYGKQHREFIFNLWELSALCQ